MYFFKISWRGSFIDIEINSTKVSIFMRYLVSIYLTLGTHQINSYVCFQGSTTAIHRTSKQ